MKNNKLPLWKEKSTFEKVLSVIGIIISMTIVILATLGFIGVWENAIDVVEPLIGVMMLIQTLQYRKYDKKIAIFSGAVAIFILAISIKILVFE